jgi:hypothetical protein
MSSTLLVISCLWPSKLALHIHTTYHFLALVFIIFAASVLPASLFFKFLLKMRFFWGFLLIKLGFNILLFSLCTVL